MSSNDEHARGRLAAPVLRMSNTPPLVYACSGCSSAAQMANQLALRLDRDRAADLSAIVDVGAGVADLIRTARSGRPILALDGCVSICVATCLSKAGVTADTHLVLSDYGVENKLDVDFDVVLADEVYLREVLPAALSMTGTARRLHC